MNLLNIISVDNIYLKTDHSSCLIHKNVLILHMIIQIMMAILIPNYYLDTEKKNTFGSEPDTIKNTVCYIVR